MLLAEEESSDGYFTFQTQLHKDGTIKFIYKEVCFKHRLNDRLLKFKSVNRSFYLTCNWVFNEMFKFVR